MWIGGVFLIPLAIVLLLSAANYFSAKSHERAAVSKAMGEALKVDSADINNRSFQERAELFKNLTKSEAESINLLQVKTNRALGWIAVTGVLIVFVAGFVGLAIFLAGVPRIK